LGTAAFGYGGPEPDRIRTDASSDYSDQSLVSFCRRQQTTL